MSTLEFLFDNVRVEQVKLRDDMEGKPVYVYDVIGFMNAGQHTVGLARCDSQMLARRLMTWWERQTMAGDHF